MEEPLEESAFFQARREVYSYALPKSQPVSSSYFDDAIFFGDSISEGIPLYQAMPNADVLAYTGISPSNALTKECFEREGKDMTMLEAAKTLGEKGKVYILLGGNSLGYEKDSFVAGYGAFLDAVKEQYPDSLIYVQSMTPVTDDVGKTYPLVSNELIEEYNQAIQDLAKEKAVYFLDIASALMDENGKLPQDASPVDGMHFTPEYYARWFSYLRSHTAPER